MPLVSQCMVVGDAKPFIACLVTLDAGRAAGLAQGARQAGRHPASPTSSTIPTCVAAVQAAVDEANQAVSQAEAIRKFVILPIDFTEEGGELTPSLKLKRAVVMKQYANEVEALYR